MQDPNHLHLLLCTRFFTHFISKFLLISISNSAPSNFIIFADKIVVSGDRFLLLRIHTATLNCKSSIGYQVGGVCRVKVLLNSHKPFYGVNPGTGARKTVISTGARGNGFLKRIKVGFSYILIFLFILPWLVC